MCCCGTRYTDGFLYRVRRFAFSHFPPKEAREGRRAPVLSVTNHSNPHVLARSRSHIPLHLSLLDGKSFWCMESRGVITCGMNCCFITANATPSCYYITACGAILLVISIATVADIQKNGGVYKAPMASSISSRIFIFIRRQEYTCLVIL